MGATLNNSEELANSDGEQSDEIQDRQPLEQTGEDSGDDAFYASRLEDINRDDLTPEMQTVYDELLEDRSNMQAGFTRRMQELASLRQDADIWQSVRDNPDLLRVMNDAIYRINNNMPLDNAGAQQQAEIPDPAQDPMGAIKAIVAEVVEDRLGAHLPGIQKGLQEVTGYVHTNQAQLEFDNLCNTYPAAKFVGFQEIERVRGQYRNSSGRPISAADAFALIARDNPRLLQQRDVTPQQQTQRRQRSPAVEQPKQPPGETLPAPAPVGVRSLRSKMEQQRKAGMLGNLQAVVDSAIAKFGGQR